MFSKKSHGGEVFGLSEAARERLLDFSININPLGMSPAGREAMLSFLDTDATRYPDVESRALREALAERYGLSKLQITCGNGATELMYAFVRAFRPSVVYVPAPAFSEYRLAAEACRVPVRSFALPPENGFQVADDSFLDSLPKDALVFLGNPNNPDGKLLPRAVFRRFIDAAERTGSWLMIDESFIDFVGSAESYRGDLKRHPRLIICQSLTKFYAVPGLRIGVTLSSPHVARMLSAALCPWNVNGLVQRYMTAAVKDEDYIFETRDYVEAERNRMGLILSGHPKLSVYPGTANFLLLRRVDEDVEWLSKRLLEKGILIRHCGNYEGLDDSFFRVAVRREEENDRLITALKEVLEE